MNEKILVVDDEEAILLGVGDLLASEGYRVTTARDGKEALARYAADRPDLVLLDVMMPEMSGYDVCRAIRRTDPVTPVMMLTAKAEEVDKVVGLELGADDYVVKPFSLRELVSRVRAALRRAYGELAVSDGPAVLHFGEVTVDLQRMRVERKGAAVALTPTEYRLLRHLVTSPDQVFSRESLLETVWGYDSSVDSQRTVDVHMRHLREKLEDDPASPHWFVTVRGAGYRYSPKGE